MQTVLRRTLSFAAACLALMFWSASVSVQTTTFTISAGASVFSINSTLATAAGTSGNVVVNFAAGSYAINSTVTVPCPVGTLTLQGPVVAYRPPAFLLPRGYSYTAPYLANLNGSLASGAGFSFSGCSRQVTIQFFNWNGGQPGGGGGGWMDFPPGQSTVTVQDNYIHGFSANTSTAHNYDDAIYLEGSGTQTPIDSNIKILWNVIGDGVSDCNSLMNLVNYQGGVYNSSGGYCGGIGVNVSTTNLVIQNNDFEHVEQPMKFFESPGGAGDFTHTLMANNVLVDSNDCGQWHRICIEAQQDVVVNNTTGSVFNFTNNSLHDPIDPQYGLFGASLPACCSNFHGYTGTGATDNRTNCNSNVMVDNVLSPTFTGYAFEWWSTGDCGNNLMQGHWNENNGNVPQQPGSGIGWGDTSNATRLWSASNNICTGSVSGDACVGREVEHTNIPPTQTNNTFSLTFTQRVSVAPSISPTPSGTYSAPITVTLTDPGYTSGGGPLGHTSIWYTTDGTTPVAGTSKFYSGPFSVAPGTTVKALGMWGALNQPTTYPATFGFAPSGVISATYSGGGGGIPTLSSTTLSCPLTALTAGAATEQCSLTCDYSDGEHLDCTNVTDLYGHGPGLYASTLPGIVAISSSAVVTPVAAGAANVTATVGALTSTLPISVASSGGGGGGGTVFLGSNQEDVTGITFANAFNSVYSISPPYPTTVGSCHFFLPTDTITSGAHYDCLIILAPTPTTQASTPLCKATYTTTSTVAPNNWVATPALSGCGTIPASTAYWVAGITDDPSGPNYGFSDCGGSCTGSAPTTYGTGTYPSYYIGGTYGTYTSLTSTLNAHTGTQVSQYVDLNATAPTLTGGYQDNTLSQNQMVLGGGFQQHAYAVYSDGVILPCDTTDARGTTVTAWTEDSAGEVLTIGAAGGAHPGLIAGVGYGSTDTHCTLTGGIICSRYTWKVTNQPATVRQVQGAKLRNATVN